MDTTKKKKESRNSDRMKHINSMFIKTRSHQLVLLTTRAGLFGFNKMPVPTWVVNSVSFWSSPPIFVLSA